MAQKRGHDLPFGDVTVIYQEASERYYIQSREVDEWGVPLLEVLVSRATISGVDKREETAVAIWELMVEQNHKFTELQEGDKQ